MTRETSLPYTQASFVRLSLQEFPELREEFAEAYGLLHLQMHAFTQHMQRAKGAGDWMTYKRGVRLAHELWRRPDERLLGALKVSFLEHLDFDGPRGAEAWNCLTSELKHGWEAMKAYNDRLADHGNPQRKPKKGKRR
jgi:hypothetical protein